MLPMIIAAAEHQLVFAPDEHSRKVKARNIERLAKGHAVSGLAVGHIDGAAVAQDVRSGDHQAAQKSVKLLRRHLVVFDFSGLRLVIDVVRRICPNHVGLFAIHEGGHVRRFCGIAAHQAVHAQQPDISQDAGGHFGIAGVGVWIFLRIYNRAHQEGIKLAITEAGERQIVQILPQLGQFHA